MPARTALRALSAATAPGILALLLLGCATERPDPDPQTTHSTSSPSAAPTTAPTTEPPQTITIPDCDAMIPLDEVHALTSPSFDPLPPQDPEATYFWSSMGPAAQEAFGRATQLKYCAWGMPNSDGYTGAIAAELPQEATEAFIGALRDSDFAESTVDSGPAFTLEQTPSIGPSVTWYGFAGNVVVGTLSFSADGGIGPPILSRLAGPGE